MFNVKQVPSILCYMSAQSQPSDVRISMPELRMDPEKLMSMAAEFRDVGLVYYDERGLFCTPCSQLIKMDRRHQRTQIWNHMKSGIHRSNTEKNKQNETKKTKTQHKKQTKQTTKRAKSNRNEKGKATGID